jgi:hypothetical protein
MNRTTNLTMERVLQQPESVRNTAAIASFDKAAAEYEQEVKKAEEVSCNQLLKNLLKTNLKLLKMNEISFILF